MRYWLMKSEPNVFSVEDLEALGDQPEPWDGVRNYQARNFMRDEMRVGDLAILYHSNAKPSGAAGVQRIVEVNVPDHTSWDPRSPYFDPKSTPEAPRWVMTEVAFVERFPRVVPLAEMKLDPELEGMALLRKGQRLSVMPLEPEHFERVVALGRGGRPET